MFRVYDVDLFLNESHFKKVWVDPHYEVKHANSMNDDLILTLLFLLNHKEVDHVAQSAGFRYYEVDIEHRKRFYRLVLVIPDDKSYLGVRNAYRRSK